MSDTSVIVSSRIRLARNLAGIPFSPVIRGSATENKIVDAVSCVLLKRGSFSLMRIKDLPEEFVRSLVERYIISRELEKSVNGALVATKDYRLSVMINEEDHLREQCFCSGFGLEEVFSKIFALDRMLRFNLKFSVGKFGFLTTCPSNVGTGMRASVMAFLPALTYSGRINDFCEQLEREGLTIRGAFGEGSVAEGYLYQISNEVTYGVNEGKIVEIVSGHAKEIAEAEREERYALYADNRLSFEDECLRAFGILSNCRKIGYPEFVGLVSKVKLGVAMGFIGADKPDGLDELIVSSRSATLSSIIKNNRSEEEKRAIFVKNAFAQLGVRP